MYSRPIVKHVLGVLEWFYMLSEKILFFFFKKAVWFFHYPRWPPRPPGLAKDHKKYGFFFSEPFPKLSEHIHQIVNYEAALIVKKFDPVKLTQGIVILYGIFTQETPLPCDRRQQATLRTADQ